MSIITKAEGLISKAESLAAILANDMKEAANTALPITTKILAALDSPEALMIESLIPSGATYAADAIAAINAVVPVLKVVNGIDSTDKPNTLAILQRLGSELTGIIHGGKHPFSWYVTCFEYVCFGTVQPTV